MDYTSDVILHSYNVIDETAKSDAMVEAISGLAGFPFTIAADGLTIVTHYLPMLNKIRSMFGKTPWTKETFGPVLKGTYNDLLFDILFDKVLGQIPLLGIYFNYICAKSLMWRMGILCAMCSCLENDIKDVESIKKAVVLIREIFPQRDTFKFAQPDYNTYKKLITSLMGNPQNIFENKINKALEAFE